MATVTLDRRTEQQVINRIRAALTRVAAPLGEQTIIQRVRQDMDVSATQVARILRDMCGRDEVYSDGPRERRQYRLTPKRLDLEVPSAGPADADLDYTPPIDSPAPEEPEEPKELAQAGETRSARIRQLLASTADGLTAAEVSRQLRHDHKVVTAALSNMVRQGLLSKGEPNAQGATRYILGRAPMTRTEAVRRATASRVAASKENGKPVVVDAADLLTRMNKLQAQIETQRAALPAAAPTAEPAVPPAPQPTSDLDDFALQVAGLVADTMRHKLGALATAAAVAEVATLREQLAVVTQERDAARGELATLRERIKALVGAAGV